ncbi:MAG: PstS family phosphate ABC transporter substrate-binding protein [Chromatiaceae bacterium]|nr:PstS family phosphate ABC transporter substrate-binding protein [Chromatiaceae bacterium]
MRHPNAPTSLVEALVLKKTLVFAALSGAIVSGAAQAAAARDYISIVGSSTVYPFATVVAEQFGKTTKFKTPKIESTGSGGGLKLFCAGVGVEHPDITNASRRIKKSEQELCAKNGVKEIVEVKIGYDGIVLGQSKDAQPLELTRKDIFLALAKQVPGKDGKLIDNPNMTWKDVNAALPNVKIEVLGPPPTSGTRDAFVELAMESGAKKFDDLAKLRDSKDEAEIKSLMAKLGIPESAFNAKGKKVFQAVAHGIREDGAYIEAGENDNLIVQKLEANPKAVGIFGFSFLDQNADKIHGALVDGKEPSFENIADGSYPVSRPLYFYVKKAHIGAVPGIAEYLAEFTSEKAMGAEGYLSDKGLIPAPDAERGQFRHDAEAMTPMSSL